MCTTWSAKCHIPETLSAIILAEIPVLVRCCHAATDNKHLTPGVGLTPLYSSLQLHPSLCQDGAGAVHRDLHGLHPADHVPVRAGAQDRGPAQ